MARRTKHDRRRDLVLIAVLAGDHGRQGVPTRYVFDLLWDDGASRPEQGRVLNSLLADCLILEADGADGRATFRLTPKGVRRAILVAADSAIALLPALTPQDFLQHPRRKHRLWEGPTTSMARTRTCRSR